MDWNSKQDVEKLVTSCLKQNRISQEILYKKFYGKMLVVCLRYIKYRAEAEDIIQNSFIDVFCKLKEFKNNGSLEGWIRRIVVHNAIDFIRLHKKSQDKTQSNELNDINNIGFDEIDVFAYEEEDRILKKAQIAFGLIKSLTPAYRNVFNLFLDGYSHADIAKTLNISVGASKSNLFKAREKLRAGYLKAIEESKILAY